MVWGSVKPSETEVTEPLLQRLPGRASRKGHLMSQIVAPATPDAPATSNVTITIAASTVTIYTATTASASAITVAASTSAALAD